MFYKVHPSSPTHTKLTALFERIKAANAAALEVVRKHGTNLYFRPGDNAAGGIFGIFFQERPSNWKQVKPGMYMPKETVNNYSKIEEMKNLPVVKKTEIIEIIQTSDPDTMPEIFCYQNIFYIDVADTPNPDLIPVTTTQYYYARANFLLSRP